MCDFNKLDDAAKQLYHDQLKACSDAFGGKNYFFQLLEAIRHSKTHPLTAKNSRFHCDRGAVVWNKVIFHDKLSLLLKARLKEDENGNILPPKEDKAYKNVLNLVRTFAPISFEVQPKNPKDGAGFTLHAFDRVDEETTRLNPLFDALFFCSVETVKKILSYEAQA